MVNNQSSITNAQPPLSRNSLVPCSPDPLLSLLSPACPGIALTRPGVASCEAGCEAGSPVFCLLPMPPILPILPPVLFCLFSISCQFVVHSFLGVFAATSQLCKTNPISKTPKPPQSLISQRLTPIFRPIQPQKTNPNKANLSRRSLWRSRIKSNSTLTYITVPAQIAHPFSAHRNTTSDIPHARYEPYLPTSQISKIPFFGNQSQQPPLPP